MRLRVLFLTLSLLTAPARAGSAADAHALLARAKAATGGAAWDQVTSLRRVFTNVLDNTETSEGSDLADVLSGRFAVAIASALPARFGWDGQRAWESQYGISNYSEQSASDTAFIRCLGQWYARCGPGAFSAEGERVHEGVRYNVVRVVSSAHHPVEFWIKRATGRIERIGYGAGLRSTVDFADFRQVGALQIPFEERTTGAGAHRPVQLLRLARVELNPALPPRSFDKPVDLPIEGLAGHPQGVTVELERCADPSHLCVAVMLNGSGPFHFIVDSGAAMNLITPETAARLGVRSEGKVLVQGTSDTASGGGLAPIARTSLGTLSQADQTFAVVPIGYPGADGLLGFQWLRQAVTRIDWAARKLTFYDPATYVYRGPAQPRVLDFHGNVPRVEARIDGHAGWFNLDTGDFAGVTVNPAFARATGLDTAYPTGQESHYGGVGGAAQALLTQARLLEFGPATLQGPQLQLSRQTRDLLSAPGLAGNLGYGVLHRFDLVLDYPGRRIYFEPNGATGCAGACPEP